MISVPTEKGERENERKQREETPLQSEVGIHFKFQQLALCRTAYVDVLEVAQVEEKQTSLGR